MMAAMAIGGLVLGRGFKHCRTIVSRCKVDPERNRRRACLTALPIAQRRT